MKRTKNCCLCCFIKGRQHTQHCETPSVGDVKWLEETGPPKSQASGPAGGQIPDGQQQTMWPPQQPAQRPAPHQAPPQPQYAGQRPMSRQLPPQPAYAEQQISYRQEQEQNPEDLYPYYQRGQEVPTYRPEDYEEYPDFPQSMLEPNVSHYQSI